MQTEKDVNTDKVVIENKLEANIQGINQHGNEETTEIFYAGFRVRRSYGIRM